MITLASAHVARATPPPIDVLRAAETGSLPKGATLSPDGRTLYVTNYGQLDHRNVSVYDAATLSLTRHFDVPGVVVESAIAPDGATLYVSNFRRDSVQFVDTATGRVTREVRAGHHPKVLALSPDGARLFAANWGSRDVTEIDTRAGTVVRTLAAGANPRGMAVRADGRLYVANFGDGSVDIYEGPAMGTHRRIEDVCRVPRHLTLAPDGSRLYVTCLTHSLLAVIDTQRERVTRRLFVGRSPKANDVTADGRYVVTANYGGSSVTVVDTQDWSVRTLDVPGMDHASGVVAARSGLGCYVTGWYDSHVFQIGITGTGPHYAVSPAVRAQTRRSREQHDLHPEE